MECEVYEHNERWFQKWLEKGKVKKIQGMSDLDNKLGSICDILGDAGVIGDDTQIVHIEATKFIGTKNPNTGAYGADIRIFEAADYRGYYQCS